MTAERAEAYVRIMEALGAHFGQVADDDVECVRNACDALVLADSVSPRDRRAMTDALIVLADLVERGDISGQVAVAMVQDIGRCAPPNVAKLDDDLTRFPA
jgi:hypothetical protein